MKISRQKTFAVSASHIFTKKLSRIPIVIAISARFSIATEIFSWKKVSRSTKKPRKPRNFSASKLSWYTVCELLYLYRTNLIYLILFKCSSSRSGSSVLFMPQAQVLFHNHAHNGINHTVDIHNNSNTHLIHNSLIHNSNILGTQEANHLQLLLTLPLLTQSLFLCQQLVS